MNKALVAAAAATLGLSVLAGCSSDDSPSRISRILFGVRYKLGEWFGWDKDDELPIPHHSGYVSTPVDIEPLTDHQKITG